MRYKPKDAKSAILIIVIILAMIVAVRYLCFGTFSSATRVGFIENGGLHGWSASYTLLDGKMERTIRTETESATLTVDVKTESGSISIEIKDTAGNVIFSETDIGTSQFTVDVQGKVKVVVTADAHKGSFRIG